MRITKAQAKENRDRVVAAASELFRAQGFEGVAVNEVMAAAGFTHGGFYNHFGSKEALAAEAVRSAFEEMAKRRERAPDLAAMLRGYFSKAARRAPGKSCPAAALAGEVGRQPDAVRASFADGLEQMIASVEARLPPGRHALSRRERAVGLVARMAGALALARAVPEANPLADELLEASLRAALREL